MKKENLQSLDLISEEESDIKWKKHNEWKKQHPVLAWFQDLQYLPKRFYDYLDWKYLNFIAFFQRGWRGWANIDTWGWYGYVAKINKEGLDLFVKYFFGLWD